MMNSMPPPRTAASSTFATSVWRLLQTHHSSRSFTSEPVDEHTLADVLTCGLRSPTWNNGQHVTAVVVRDKDRKRQLSVLCGSQPSIAEAPVFVTLVMDFHRTALAAGMHGRTQHVQDNVNGVLIGAVDVGIVLATLMAAARAAGLAVCPIGGIRRHSQQVCELLELPPLTFPMASMAMGHPVQTEVPLKPRFDLPAFAHEERYQPERCQEGLSSIDVRYASYSATLGRPDAPTWTNAISTRYAQADYADVGRVLASRGFRLA